MLFFFALSPSFSLYIRRRTITLNQKEIICYTKLYLDYDAKRYK
jgi:hypothetical protein